MGWLTDLAKQHPALSGAQDVFAALEQRIAVLEKEVESLRTATSPSLTDAAPQFAEASGVLWKSKRSGGYEANPYCPTCRGSLADYSGFLTCYRCNWQAPLKSFEVPKVYKDLFGSS